MLTVIVHVAGLWLTSPPDVIDVLLFRSPTPFSAWGAIAMWAVFAAALWAALGCTFGIVPHLAAATLGMAAILHASAVLFNAVKFAGVAYLLYQAWGAIMHPGSAQPPGQAVRASRAFRAGLMVSLTNPKVILFVLAFVPQFIRPEAGSVLGQFLVFGAIIGLGGVMINGGVGVFAGGGNGEFAVTLQKL